MDSVLPRLNPFTELLTLAQQQLHAASFTPGVPDSIRENFTKLAKVFLEPPSDDSIKQAIDHVDLGRNELAEFIVELDKSDNRAAWALQEALDAANKADRTLREIQALPEADRVRLLAQHDRAVREWQLPAVGVDQKRTRHELIEELIQDSKDIELAVSKIQSDSVGKSNLNDAEIQSVVESYVAWYHRSLMLLPDQLKSRFIQEYEGDSNTDHIRSFLAEPMSTTYPPIALVSPNIEPSRPYWRYTFERAFQKPVQRQRMVLIEAKTIVSSDQEDNDATRRSLHNLAAFTKLEELFELVELLDTIRTDLEITSSEINAYLMKVTSIDIETLDYEEWAKLSRNSVHLNASLDRYIDRHFQHDIQPGLELERVVDVARQVLEKIREIEGLDAGTLRVAIDAMQRDLPRRQERNTSRHQVEGMQEVTDKPVESVVFVGHGHSDLYLRVVRYLEKTLRLKTVFFEDEVRAGLHALDVISGFLDQASFAVIVATGDDLTEEGEAQARLNVIHEIGLFQGRLGFRKVALMRQQNVREFSNLAGYQDLRFDGNNINSKFEELRAMLVRERMIAS